MSRRTNAAVVVAVLVAAISCLIPVSSVAEFSATTEASVQITFDIPDDAPTGDVVISDPPTNVDPEPEPEPDPEPTPPSDSTDTAPPETEVVTPTPEPEPEATPVAPVVDPVVPEPSAQQAPLPPEPEGSSNEEISQ